MKVIEIAEPILVGGVGEISFGTQYRQGNRIYDSDGIAMALMAQPIGNAGGNSYLYKVDEPLIAAYRGRNPRNPSDRTAGIPMEQRLEINQNGTSNTLTTVQKDNVVVEPSGIYTQVSERFQRGPLEGLSRTLKAGTHDAGVLQN